jgi:hypothetical protein
LWPIPDRLYKLRRTLYSGILSEVGNLDLNQFLAGFERIGQVDAMGLSRSLNNDDFKCLRAVHAFDTGHSDV